MDVFCNGASPVVKQDVQKHSGDLRNEPTNGQQKIFGARFSQGYYALDQGHAVETDKLLREMTNEPNQ